MRGLLVAMTVLGLACGGQHRTGRTGTPAPPPAAATPARSQTSSLHVVEMLVTPDGQYIYKPSTLTIHVGDRVQWVNVSGGPHNVAFYRERVPPGAADFLEARMPDRMGDLTGTLLFEPDAVYEISFAGAPVGTYGYFCTPHELLGMKAELIVAR